MNDAWNLITSLSHAWNHDLGLFFAHWGARSGDGVWNKVTKSNKAQGTTHFIGAIVVKYYTIFWSFTGLNFGQIDK